MFQLTGNLAAWPTTVVRHDKTCLGSLYFRHKRKILRALTGPPDTRDSLSLSLSVSLGGNAAAACSEGGPFNFDGRFVGRFNERRVRSAKAPDPPEFRIELHRQSAGSTVKISPWGIRASSGGIIDQSLSRTNERTLNDAAAMFIEPAFFATLTTIRLLLFLFFSFFSFFFCFRLSRDAAGDYSNQMIIDARQLIPRLFPNAGDYGAIVFAYGEIITGACRFSNSRIETRLIVESVPTRVDIHRAIPWTLPRGDVQSRSKILGQVYRTSRSMDDTLIDSST